MADVWVIISSGLPEERAVRVDGRLCVGRECAGVDEAHRLLLDEATVSRDHAEIRAAGKDVLLVDRSTNGTLVNGRRIERDEWHPLAHGDVVGIGATDLTLQVVDDAEAARDFHMSTAKSMSMRRMALLVGDIVDYTPLTEARGGAVVAAAGEALWQHVRRCVVEHGGTVVSYAGDAVLATWDDVDETGAASALRCAIAAAAEVTVRAPELEVRTVEGEPIHMGWAVTIGDVATGRTSPSKIAVFGDAVNLAFRLSGVAGREGMPAVLVTEEVARFAPDEVTVGPAHEITVKGKSGPTTAFGVQ